MDTTTFPTRYIHVTKPIGTVHVHKLTASDAAIADFVRRVNDGGKSIAKEITKVEFARLREQQYSQTA